MLTVRLLWLSLVVSGVARPQKRRLHRPLEVDVEGGVNQSRSLLHRLRLLLAAAGSEAVKLKSV
jgi:hypothetical protein